MTGSLMPYCEGRGCGMKLKCCRYKEKIDYKSELHFPYSPNSAEYKCTFFVGDITEGLKETFLNHLKDLKDEKGGKN